MTNKFQNSKTIDSAINNIDSGSNNLMKIISSEPIIKIGVKKIKHWIDNNFRDKVKPKKGSIIYSDLFGVVEHSGIYIGNNNISNIIFDDFRGKVKKIQSKRFTKESKMYKEIYVSCDENGAVGDINVSNGAESHIGEEYIYGLIFSNCHDFSRKCLDYAGERYFDNKEFKIVDFNETWESTIEKLKDKAKEKIGATKWKLWDWKSDKIKTTEKIKKPNLNELFNQLKNIPLNEEIIQLLINQKNDIQNYKYEISDEKIPDKALDLLNNIIEEISEINSTYNNAKDFIDFIGQGYSYNQIKELNEDFSSLVKEMKNNREISNLINKLGREYISKEKKLKTKISRRSKKEVFGIHHSNELERVLTNELVNLENEELEYLFYSRYLEESLLAFELSGEVEDKTNEKIKGPVIACLDTSGSMSGDPILKAKSLLLLIMKILKREDRSLHLLLFGDEGDIEERMIKNKNESFRLLLFLNKGFGGGTDFETPLKRAVEIVEEKKSFNKADILMITDGASNISLEFKDYLLQKKIELNFNIYTVLTNEIKEENDFSDEVVLV